MSLVLTTWNLQGHAGLDVESVALYLSEQGSDVALLQEIQRRQCRQLAQALAVRSRHWSFKHWPIRTRAEGMAVLGITQPLDDVRSAALTRRWRLWDWRRRIVQFARLGDLQLANVHLSSGPGAREQRPREAAWVVQRLDRLSPAGPRLVAGDFNSRPSAALLQRMRDARWTDAWVHAHAGRDDVGATNWQPGPRTGPPVNRIDYVWVSPEVEVVSAHLPAYASQGFKRLPRLSDHLPLTVTLRTRSNLPPKSRP